MGNPEDFTLVISIDFHDFKRFAYFDTIYCKHRYRRPLLFFLLMAAFSGVCFSMVGSRENALLLACVLLAVALILPLGYLLHYAISLRDQAKTLHLYYPREVYTLRFTDEAFYATPTGQEKPLRLPWGKLHHAYRTSNAIYIYINDARAFLVPLQAASEQVWHTITRHCDSSRCTVR